MTQDIEQALWSAYKERGDVQAREELIVRYMAPARALAARLPEAKCAESRQDAISEAYVALIRCVDMYEPERGVAFLAMAAQRIRGAVIDYVRKLTPGSRSDRPMHTLSYDGFVQADMEDNLPALVQEDTVLAQVQVQDNEQTLGRFLQSLSAVQRWVLLLYVLEEVPHTEIARGLGFSAFRSRQVLMELRKRWRCYSVRGFLELIN